MRRILDGRKHSEVCRRVGGISKRELLHVFSRREKTLKVALKGLTSVGGKMGCSYVSWCKPVQRHLQIQEGDMRESLARTIDF